MPGGWDGSGNVYNYDGTHTPSDTQCAQQTTIDQTAFDTMFTTLSNAIENCVARDGQNSPSANLPMNSKKLTGLTTGSALTDSVNASQLVSSSLTYGGTSTGSANTQAISCTIAPAAYAAGQVFSFIAGYTNTGATTINVNSLGAKSIYIQGSNISAGQITATRLYVIVYTGSVFELVNPSYSWADYSPTTTGLTSNGSGAARYSLVGRTCHIKLYWGGTSNATTFTITLPFTASAYNVVPISRIMDNGTYLTTATTGEIQASTSILHLYTNCSDGPFTSSGSKTVQAMFFYELL